MGVNDTTLLKCENNGINLTARATKTMIPLLFACLLLILRSANFGKQFNIPSFIIQFKVWLDGKNRTFIESASVLFPMIWKSEVSNAMPSINQTASSFL